MKMKQRGFEPVSTYAGSVSIPVRKTASSAGYDMEAAESMTIPPHAMALVPTGLKAYMQTDEVLMIHIRSSMAVRQHLMLANSVGIIDADYYNNADNEGHILIAIWNGGEKAAAIARGERIAQGIFVKYLVVDADAAGAGALRSGGFGSTGCGSVRSSLCGLNS